MRPESHTKKTDDPASTTTETMTSHRGGPKASRAGMTMGEKRGMMDDQTARLELGACTATNMI